MRTEAEAPGTGLGIVERCRQIVQGVDARDAALTGEATGFSVGVCDGDGLDGLDLKLSGVSLNEMDAREQTIVPADGITRHVGGAVVEEVAEPIEDQRFAVHFPRRARRVRDGRQ